jgi:hypothetical protein
MKIAVVSCVFAGLVAAVSAPALANHSVAMFDLTKNVTIQGTVKEFQFTNPHSWLQVMVTGADGTAVEWDFEAQGPSSLLRVGIKAKTFSPGDKVTVVAHPMKDGRTAGALITATAADGHVYTL